LTFLGHVTSSITWPIDSAYAISYRCDATRNGHTCIVMWHTTKHLPSNTLSDSHNQWSAPYE